MRKAQISTPSAGPETIVATLSAGRSVGRLPSLCDTLPRQAVELSALDARVRDLLLCVYEVALPPHSPRISPRFTGAPGIIAAHPL